LQYTSKKLRTDRVVVLTAVQQNGLSLIYASEELRADRVVVLTAIKQNSLALPYASEELKNDKKFLIECYRINTDTIYNNKFIEEFDKLENGLFNDTFIIENIDFSNLLKNLLLAAIHRGKIIKNIEFLDLVTNKKQLYEYLINNKKFDSLFWNEKNKNDIIYNILRLIYLKK
jgi:hypothetical protein